MQDVAARHASSFSSGKKDHAIILLAPRRGFPRPMMSMENEAGYELGQAIAPPPPLRFFDPTSLDTRRDDYGNQLCWKFVRQAFRNVPVLHLALGRVSGQQH
jgi:hypothetical protein